MIDKVKIGWREYTIKDTQEPHEILGEARYDALEIYVKPGEKTKKIVLLHEILHCIFCYMGSPHRKDEDFVSGLADHLYALIISNPELINYLNDKEEMKSA